MPDDRIGQPEIIPASSVARAIQMAGRGAKRFLFGTKLLYCT